MASSGLNAASDESCPAPSPWPARNGLMLTEREVGVSQDLINLAGLRGVHRALNVLALQGLYWIKCFLYFPLAFVLRLLLPWKRSLRQRDPLMQRFKEKWGIVSPALRERCCSQPTIWINANTGGELIQAQGFLEALKRTLPEWNIILSTESYDTYQFAQAAGVVDAIFFPPWDMGLTARRVLRQIRPRAIIFIETSLSPVLLRWARRMGVRTGLLSAFLSSKAEVGNRLLRRAVLLGVHREIEFFWAKGEADRDGFLALGVPADRIKVVGDLRMDVGHLRLSSRQASALRAEIGWNHSDPILVVGSLHLGEVDLIANAFRLAMRSVSNLRLLVAPRWSHEAGQIADLFSRKHSLFCANRTEVGLCAKPCPEVLILDTFGELPYFYGLGQVAFIGSSVVSINERGGGHNLIQPLAHGNPVLFGRNMALWRNLADEIKAVWPEAEVYDADSFAKSLIIALENQDVRDRIRVKSEEIVLRHADVVARNVQAVAQAIGG